MSIQSMLNQVTATAAGAAYLIRGQTAEDRKMAAERNIANRDAAIVEITTKYPHLTDTQKEQLVGNVNSKSGWVENLDAKTTNTITGNKIMANTYNREFTGSIHSPNNTYAEDLRSATQQNIANYNAKQAIGQRLLSAKQAKQRARESMQNAQDEVRDFRATHNNKIGFEVEM